ncbi:MAG: flagellar basal body P-ring formation chaperone FlgA [Parvularculaceae bacterium]
MKFPVAIFAAAIASLAPASAAQRAADLLPAIEAALAEKGAPADVQVILTSPEQPVPDNATFDSVSFNQVNGRFAIRLSAAGAQPSIVSGSARAPVETPVLIEAVPRGEEIREENIGFASTANVLAADTVFEVESLVGAVARRNLGAGAPLRRADVAQPVLVKKNSLVTVAYEAPGLSLTQSGVAQSNGAKGDVIDIETVQTGRVIRAVVSGTNFAVIAGARLAAREQ